MDLVVSHINRMAGKSPLLILDDAGKLAHSALCTLIPLYLSLIHIFFLFRGGMFQKKQTYLPEFAMYTQIKKAVYVLIEIKRHAIQVF